MPNLDDELRRRMQRAGRRVDRDGLEDRLHARRAHKQITQKVGRGFLAVTVLAGSAFGVAGLNRAFRGDPGPADVTPGAGGTIAYMRQLRSCDGMTVGESSTDVVGLDLATGDLRVVRTTPLFTGGDRPLAERAPEFSPDGTKMAWADAYPYNLEVTDVASGQTQQVTHGLSVGAPHWSPDGTKLLFAAGERRRDPSSQGEFTDGPDAVYTMNTDGSDLRKLTDGTLPIWSPDGRIAFIRGGPGLTHLGTPTEIVSSATSFYVMNADGTGLDKVYEAPGDVLIRDAEWSPDGTKVVAEATFQGSVDIFVVDLGLRTAIQLTDDPTQDTSPTWSPDGSMIAFQTGRYGDETSRYGEDGHSEIAVMNADGSNVRRLTNDCVDDYNPTWLRNDDAVHTLPVWGDLGAPSAADPSDILVAGSDAGFTDIFGVDPATGATTNITADHAEQLDPAWSPDHSQIAFSGDTQRPGNIDIYVMNADGSGLRRLTTDPEAETRPAWSPDGSTIAFEGKAGVWSVRTDGSDLHKVADNQASGGYYPTWSPDGSTIAYSEDGSLYTVDAGGGDPTLILSGHQGYELSWSPDGSKILFTCERDLCTTTPDGSDVVNLTQGAQDRYERDADWSPDGSQIVFTRNDQLFVMNADGSDSHAIGTTSNCCPGPDW